MLSLCVQIVLRTEQAGAVIEYAAEVQVQAVIGQHLPVTVVQIGAIESQRVALDPQTGGAGILIEHLYCVEGEIGRTMNEACTVINHRLRRAEDHIPQ